jgi:hypothetical protein
VGDWRDWTKGEFFTLMKSSCILLRKSRQAYLKGFESATGVTLRTGIEVAEGNGLMKQEKKSSGGDMMAQSRKVLSDTFNATKWSPDPHVYEGVPKKTDVLYMDPEDEKLYVDKLWLALQVLARSLPRSLARSLARGRPWEGCHCAHATRADDATCARPRRRTSSRLLATTCSRAWPSASSRSTASSSHVADSFMPLS